MVDFRPFRAVRYTAAAGPLAELICPPFDVISPEQERALIARSAYNMVNLELSEVSGVGPGERYARAADAYERWQASGILARDADPAYYVMRQRFPDGARTRERFGLLGALRLEELGTGVLAHEDTAPGVKEDRLALMRAAQANFSPLMMLFRDPGGRIAEVRQQAAAAEPAADFTSDDGQSYAMWPITDARAARAVGQALGSRSVYIADGHHRYETALAYEHERGEAGDGAHHYVMTALIDFDDPGLLIRPYYRVVHGLDAGRMRKLRGLLDGRFVSEAANVPGQAAAAFDLAVAEAGEGRVALGVAERDKPLVVLTLAGDAVGPPASDGPPAEQARSVEAFVLQETLFRPVMGDTVAEHVAYVHDGQEALDMVARGDGQMAFFIKGVPAGVFEAVVGSGIRLPRKTTYFYPKLPSGLVISPLNGAL